MGLLRMMQRKRKIRKLFRVYGKTVYRARVDYVKNYLLETADVTGYASYKPRLKKIIVAVLILTMLMAIIIVGAKSFEFPLPTFSFVERNDHTEVQVRLEGDEKTKTFLKIGYVPEGYTHIETESFEEVTCRNIYINHKGEYLYIEQYLSEDSVANIDSEDCSRYTETVEGLNVQAFAYEDGRLIFLLVKSDVYIVIEGKLAKEEMRLIVQKLI